MVFLPSHQIIQKWIQTGIKGIIYNGKFDYSRYYVYYEQYIKIKGDRNYRLTLYDFILNIPVAEGKVPKLEKTVIQNFIKETTNEKPFYTLTTDLVPEYKSIADEFGVIHQQCIFHFTKMLNEPVFRILRDKKVDKQDKMRLILYGTEIKNIFRTFNEKNSNRKIRNTIRKI